MISDFVQSFVRTNFRAYALRENWEVSRVSIFAARLYSEILITCYMAIETKNRGQFCENLNWKYFRARNSKIRY